jgi:hypothetical protein
MKLEYDDASRSTSILNEIFNMANQNIEERERAQHQRYDVKVHQQ